MSYLCRSNSYGWPLGLVSTVKPLARGGNTECKVENNVPDYTFYKKSLLSGLPTSVFKCINAEQKPYLYTRFETHWSVQLLS